jgi:hypothetical protein
MDVDNYIKVADLLTDDEWSGVCTRFGFADLTKSAFKKAPTTFFDRVSKTSYAMAVLETVAPLARMLSDVIQLLRRCEVHARTTNSIVVLSDQFQLTQQQYDLATKWSDTLLRSIDHSIWSDLENVLDSTIHPLLTRLWESARPTITFEQEDVVDIFLEDPYEFREPREWTEAMYSEETLEECKHALSLISDAVPSPGQDAPIFEPQFLERLNGLLQDLQDQYHRFEHQISQAQVKRRLSLPGLTPEDHEALRIFVERLKFLADWERRNGFEDLLQIDIFRHRPQLYEVWALSYILFTMANAGFEIDLLEVLDDGHGGKRWELKYAKALRPVAELTTAHGEHLFLFYQLFRRRGSGDMPDISMWDNPEGLGHPIWVVDPKFSEKGGYTATDYKRTAQRYRSRFRPRSFSTIVEYFARPEISVPASDAILDVRPGGGGLQRLTDYLRRAHDLGPFRVAVIDVSASFSEKLGAAANRLSNPQLGLLADQFITFASDATVHNNLSAALRDGGKTLAEMAGGSTQYEPLLKTMHALQAQMGGDVQFVVVSDFGFDGASESDLLSSGLNVQAIKL